MGVQKKGHDGRKGEVFACGALIQNLKHLKDLQESSYLNDLQDKVIQQGFPTDPVHGRARCPPVLGAFETCRKHLPRTILFRQTTKNVTALS